MTHDSERMGTLMGAVRSKVTGGCQLGGHERSVITELVVCGHMTKENKNKKNKNKEEYSGQELQAPAEELGQEGPLHL